MSLWKWSQTAASNATADSSINWAEGQAPSSVNDSGRGMMAAVAKYRDDIAGAITTGGSTTAYTVTSNQSFDTLAHLSGQMIAFVPHATNAGGGGTQVTLNVDGLGAKPIRFAPSVNIESGTLVLGTPYVVTYNNSDAAFYLQNFGTNPYQIPLGGMIPYIGSTAPNSAFVLPFGQAVSQTTYATLFALVGANAFGTDGGGLFSLPDLRGRVPFCQDNIGGSTAGRITNAGSGIVGTTRGATGGAETVTLNANNIPSLAVKYNQIGVQSGAGTTVAQNIDSSGAVTSNAAVNVNQPTVSPNKMPPAIIVPYILRVL